MTTVTRPIQVVRHKAMSLLWVIHNESTSKEMTTVLHYCKKHTRNRYAENVRFSEHLFSNKNDFRTNNLMSTSQQLDCLLSYLILSTRL